MGRSRCCDKVGLKKGPWTPEEDQKLLTYIQEHGHGSWRALPPKAGLQRCGKSCRLRWTNYLRPDIKRGKFSSQEEQTIIQLHALLGNRWSAIVRHLPKRTDNEIKNYWNTHLKKKLMKMGIDPMTHKPKNHALGSGQPKDTTNLIHMAQWESARLEAEARIVRENKLVTNSIHSILLNKAKATAKPPHPWPPCLDILKVWQGAWTKPRKDTTTKLVNGFFTSKESLKSPMSILNFSDNTVPIPNIGSVQDNVLGRGINYVGHPIGKNSDNQLNGIMENSTQFHDITADPTSFIAYSGDPLEAPSFWEGYTDFAANISSASTATGLADDDSEDNKISYWSNILSHVVNSPINSTVL